MTIRLYHHDSYLREMEAKVIRVEGNRVAFDQTIFYAHSGGQPADHGILNWSEGNATVTDVRQGGDWIWHQLEGDMPVEGTKVHGILDWTRRYALMRAHTALHILCGVIWRDYHAPVTGGSMEPSNARMDFELEGMSSDLAKVIEESTNIEIAANREICVRFLPREEAFAIPDLIRTKINLLPQNITEIRIVDIVGLDLQADGGTHVTRTSEVGHIRIAGYESKGRANKRIRLVIED